MHDVQHPLLDLSSSLLVDWQKAGLPKLTLVRLAKVVTLDRKLAKRKLGRLLKTDQQSIMTKFKELFVLSLS